VHGLDIRMIARLILHEIASYWMTSFREGQ
jgi:hypothetical protein